jgi:amino acid transporter/nucleotide-binding universal stress UspA family protein
VTDRTQVSSELSRELSLFQITMMGLGMMIGAGVFLGMGYSIYEAGPGGVVLTFALNGVIATFSAMSYAELSSAIPRAGGAYNFARIGFGRGTSFLAGWMEWFASSVAGSMYALTFAIYTLRYLEQLGLLPWLQGYMSIAEKVVAVAAAAFFLYINYRGASETGKVGAFFTIGQTLFVVFIAIAGIFVIMRDPSRVQNFKPFLPNGWPRLLATMGFTYVAFEGFEVIAQTGDEAIDPKRNLPKAMLYSVLTVTLVYVSVAFATVVSVKAGSPGVEGAPWEWIGHFKERGFGEAVARMMPMGNLLLTLAVIFSATSALNATVYSATRASYALGRDRMLPAFFAAISRKRRTPWVALAFTGIIVLVVATMLPTQDVASSASMMFLFLFFLVNICVIKIRRNMGDELTYGFLMPFFPFIPLIAVVCQAFLAVWLVHMSWIAWIVAPTWVLAGVGIYQFYSKRRAVTTADEILVFEEEKAPEGREYRIMVAVANPKNAVELVRNTYKLCGAKRGRVELLHMVPVPDQVPLTDAEQYMLEGREGIVEAMLYLAPRFPISTTFRYCRNVARGIVSAVREKKVDMLIMGWHGTPRAREFDLGSTVDPVIELTPCNVVIMKDCGNRKFNRVLVPLAGGPNGEFALEIASILVDKTEGEIVALTIVTDEKRFDIDRFVHERRGRIHVPSDRVRTKTVSAGNVVDAILEEVEDYDLIVMGSTREPLMYQLANPPVPETVAQKCTKPLVMVKASGGIRSWVKRWI